MALKRTTIFLDSTEHQQLFERSLEESRKAGRRVTMTEIIRRAVKAYLQAPAGKKRPRPSR